MLVSVVAVVAPAPTSAAVLDFDVCLREWARALALPPSARLVLAAPERGVLRAVVLDGVGSCWTALVAVPAWLGSLELDESPVALSPEADFPCSSDGLGEPLDSDPDLFFPGGSSPPADLEDSLPGGVAPADLPGADTLITGVSTSVVLVVLDDSSPTETLISDFFPVEEEPDEDLDDDEEDEELEEEEDSEDSPMLTLSSGVLMLSSDFAAGASPAVSAASAPAGLRHRVASSARSARPAIVLSSPDCMAPASLANEARLGKTSGTSLGKADDGAVRIGAHADLVGQARHESQSPAMFESGALVWAADPEAPVIAHEKSEAIVFGNGAQMY